MCVRLFVLRQNVAERFAGLVWGLGIGTHSCILIQGWGIGHETFLYCGIISRGDIRSAMPRWIRLIRPHDFVWLLVFAVLAATTDHGDAYELAPLILLGIAQILEPKIPAVATNRSRVF